MLGVLALVLGFTFSVALQRFDRRSEAVIDEANAIGTTYLRAYLLPASVRNDVLTSLQEYLGLRVETGGVALDRHDERRALIARAAAVQDVIWRYARQAADEDPSLATTGLFIQSLNDTIDAFGRRNAEFDRHVPEVAWYVLYGVFLIVVGVMGFSAGLSGNRPFAVNYIMAAVVVLLMLLITDLDRPWRGIITVSQASMLELQSAVGAGTYGNGVVPAH
jgi:hypothetical protein